MRGLIALLALILALCVAPSIVNAGVAPGCTYTGIDSTVDPNLLSNANVSVTTTWGVGYLIHRMTPTTGPNVVSGGPNVTRGLIFYPDSTSDGQGYIQHCHKIAELHYFVACIQRMYCNSNSDDLNMDLATAEILSEHDYPLWAVIGHGDGAQVAAKIAVSFYPKIKGLILLDGDHGSVTLSGSKTIATAAVTSTSSTFYKTASQKQLLHNTTYFVNLNVDHSDFGFHRKATGKDHNVNEVTANQTIAFNSVTALVAQVLSVLHYPDPEVTVWPWVAASTLANRYYYDSARKFHVFGNVSSASVGLIFYPGAAVPSISYSVWASQVAAASDQFLIVILEVPLRIAPYDMFAATRVPVAFPNVAKWAVSGHSLGAVAAGQALCTMTVGLPGAIFANPKVKGGLYMAGAPVCNLVAAGSSFKFVSMGGTLDIPSSGSPLARFQFAFASSVPPTAGDGYPKFVIIPNGNHGYFGRYGYQIGDGITTLSRESQEATTVSTITNLLGAL